MFIYKITLNSYDPLPFYGDTEKAAMAEACEHIVEEITEFLVDSNIDSYTIKHYRDVIDSISFGSYRHAIEEWDSNWELERCHVSTDIPLFDFPTFPTPDTDESSEESIPPVLLTPANNHTCVGCGNTKCSKIEKSCWKCGTQI